MTCCYLFLKCLKCSTLAYETWRLLHNWNYLIDAKFEARAAHIHGVGRRYFPIYSLRVCAVLLCVAFKPFRFDGR